MSDHAREKALSGSPGGVNRSLIEEAARLKAWIRNKMRGECRVLSQGNACECPLCRVDRITAALTEAAPPEKEPPMECVGCQDGINAKTQDRIRDFIEQRVCPKPGEGHIDGSGCDSGDPVDLTLDEIGQGLRILEDRIDTLASQATAEAAQPQEQKPCRALHELTGARCELPAGHDQNHRGAFCDGISQWPKGSAEAAQQEQEPEICICAAMMLDDGRVIRGHRHDDCIQTALKWREAGQDIGQVRMEAQGFITSRNRFVDRVEGMRLQVEAGLFKARPGAQILMSEDLY